jgi:hypothetical protein
MSKNNQEECWPKIEKFSSLAAMQDRGVALWDSGFVVLRMGFSDTGEGFQGYSAFRKREDGLEESFMLEFAEGADHSGDFMAIFDRLKSH